VVVVVGGVDVLFGTKNFGEIICGKYSFSLKKLLLIRK
jgi:hypothetical protein